MRGNADETRNLLKAYWEETADVIPAGRGGFPGAAQGAKARRL